MRPVNKWLPGWVTLSDGSPLKIEEDYHPYRKAKRDLCENLGLYPVATGVIMGYKKNRL